MCVHQIHLYFLFLVCCRLFLITSSNLIKSCENQIPKSFSATQRNEFCTSCQGNLGPVKCANDAKHQFKLKYEDVFDLCVNSTSTGPVECFKTLSLTERQGFGKKLCSGVVSSQPAKCLQTILLSRFYSKGDFDHALTFCRGAPFASSIDCLLTSLQIKGVSKFDAYSSCASATGEGKHIIDCIPMVFNSVGNKFLSEQSAILLSFCSAVTSDIPISCFTAGIRARLPVSFTLSLCSEAKSKNELVLCASMLMQTYPRIDQAIVITLCRTAVDVAPAMCYVSGHGFISDKSLVPLCISTVGSVSGGGGPVGCYKRSKVVLSHIDDAYRISICQGAVSDSPIDCVVKLPPWLAVSEKINLCSGATTANYIEPSKCLNLISNGYRKFITSKGAVAHTSKALGYDRSQITHVQGLEVRDSLLNLCSFAGSSSPLAAADCFQSTAPPTSLLSAIQLCRNTSVHIPSDQRGFQTHVTGLCLSRCPRDWVTGECSELCDLIATEAQVEAVHSCMKQAVTSQRFRPVDAAQVCKYEVDGSLSVFQCIKAARKTAKGKPLPTQDLAEICGAASQSEPDWTAAAAGTCLGTVLNSRLTFDKEAISALCSASQPQTRLACLERSSLHLVQVSDIATCKHQTSIVSNVHVIKFTAENNDVEATAGRWFSLRLGLIDQNRVPMLDSGVALSVNIDASNEQGAVLWGTRSNVSHAGVVHFSRLSISVPGPIQLSVIFRDQLIATFRMVVKRNPDQDVAAECIDTFRLQATPVGTSATAHSSMFPRERGLVYAASGGDFATYLHMLLCTSTLQQWSVDVWPDPSGDVWLEYRKGIDAIWTGDGFPTHDMSPEDRLGVKTGASMKEVRRAYYRMSLLWHPDRWAALPEYLVAATGAFELVSNAYETLQRNATSTSI